MEGQRHLRAKEFADALNRLASEPEASLQRLASIHRVNSGDRFPGASQQLVILVVFGDVTVLPLTVPAVCPCS